MPSPGQRRRPLSHLYTPIIASPDSSLLALSQYTLLVPISQPYVVTIPIISMAEVISESQPRIKFQLEYVGSAETTSGSCEELRKLAAAMAEMERLGAAPVLSDGKVGGNCGLRDAAGDLLVSKSG